MLKLNEKLIARLYYRIPNNLALYDQLTGCHNYNWLNMISKKNKYINKGLYVTVIDLNGFKEINDTKGHSYGNYLLRKVADQLCKVKALDKHSHVIRFGGDEFILISEIDIEDKLEKEATNIISFGSTYKHKGETIEHAIIRADKNMYEYKKNLYEKGIINNRRKGI